jgi:hypothetical protein
MMNGLLEGAGMVRNVGFLTIVLLVAVAGCKKGDPAKGGAEGGAASASTGAGAGAGDVPCKEDQYKTVVNGKVQKCMLTKDYTVDGYTCEGAKFAELFPDGKLKDCYLRTAKVVDGYSCKEGLSLLPTGKLRRCKVTANKTAAPGVEVRAGDWVTLYDGGTIKRLELASGPNKILGLPCKGYLNYLHENGKLKKCELSEDATIEGKKVSSKSDAGYVYVCFDDKGKRVPDCNVLTGMTMD